MSLLDRMKKQAAERKAELESRYTKINWFVASDGENLIRVLPCMKDPEAFFYVEKTIHFVPRKLDNGRIINPPVACLSEFDEDCPYCAAWEFAKAKEDKAASKLRPIRRVLYNVINYEKKEICVYAAPVSVHDGIMGWIDDLDCEFWDLEQGRDWKVVRTSKGNRTDYQVKPNFKATAVPEKLLGLLDEGVVDLDTVWTENCREVMEASLEQMGISVPPSDSGSGSSGDDEPEDDGFVEAKPKKSTKSTVFKKRNGASASTKKKEPLAEDEIPFGNPVDTQGDAGLDDELKRMGIQ